MMQSSGAAPEKWETDVLARLDELTDLISHDTATAEKWKDFLVALVEHRGDSNSVHLHRAAADLMRITGEERWVQAILSFVHALGDLELPIRRQLWLIGLRASALIREDQERRLNEMHIDLVHLATPVIPIWREVLLVPLIGTLDSERAQSIAEKVLFKVAESRARVAIVDVTGITYIDTAVGGFLLELFQALRLLGCQVVLTGIKPEVAQTLVKLGVSFDLVHIKRDLEDALLFATAQVGGRVLTGAVSREGRQIDGKR